MSHDKTLLITGASSGIGEATARLAAKEGWRLALAARSMDKLEGLAEELGADRAKAFTVDVTDYESQEKMVQNTIDTFGSIDAVFANAGVGGSPGGFSCAPIESWQQIVNVNILGTAYTLRASLGALKQSKGHVLITGSVAGRWTLAGSMYSASKWGVSAIGYGLREELRGTGVRVTIIEPGLVDTPFFDKPKPEGLRAEDVAQSVLFALSQPASVELHELMILPTQPAEAS